MGSGDAGGCGVPAYLQFPIFRGQRCCPIRSQDPQEDQDRLKMLMPHSLHKEKSLKRNNLQTVRRRNCCQETWWQFSFSYHPRIRRRKSCCHFPCPIAPPFIRSHDGREQPLIKQLAHCRPASIHIYTGRGVMLGIAHLDWGWVNHSEIEHHGSISVGLGSSGPETWAEPWLAWGLARAALLRTVA